MVAEAAGKNRQGAIAQTTAAPIADEDYPAVSFSQWPPADQAHGLCKLQKLGRFLHSFFIHQTHLCEVQPHRALCARLHPPLGERIAELYASEGWSQ